MHLHHGHDLGGGSAQVRVNTDQLEAYLELSDTYAGRTVSPSLGELLGLRGVLEAAEEHGMVKDMIAKSVINEHHDMVMSAFRVFNSSVLKTNFYTPTKVALSFRLNPSFLPAEEYPQPLYGMFLVISSEFRGFHVDDSLR